MLLLEGEAGSDHAADALRTLTVEDVVVAVQQVVGLQPDGDVAVEAIAGTRMQVDDIVHFNKFVKILGYHVVIVRTRNVVIVEQGHAATAILETDVKR